MELSTDLITSKALASDQNSSKGKHSHSGSFYNLTDLWPYFEKTWHIVGWMCNFCNAHFQYLRAILAILQFLSFSYYHKKYILLSVMKAKCKLLRWKSHFLQTSLFIWSEQLLSTQSRLLGVLIRVGVSRLARYSHFRQSTKQRRKLDIQWQGMTKFGSSFDLYVHFWNNVMLTECIVYGCSLHIHSNDSKPYFLDFMLGACV